MVTTVQSQRTREVGESTHTSRPRGVTAASAPGGKLHKHDCAPAAASGVSPPDAFIQGHCEVQCGGRCSPTSRRQWPPGGPRRGTTEIRGKHKVPRIGEATAASCRLIVPPHVPASMSSTARFHRTSSGLPSLPLSSANLPFANLSTYQP